MLLSGNHDDDKHKLCGEKHLNEETLGFVGASSQCGRDDHRARKQRRDHSSGTNSGHELGNYHDNGAHSAETADEEQGEGDLPISHVNLKVTAAQRNKLGSE